MMEVPRKRFGDQRALIGIGSRLACEAGKAAKRGGGKAGNVLNFNAICYFITRYAGILLTILATLVAALLVVDSLRSEESEGRIRVVDGDTVYAGKERVRLLDIDAAEIHHAQCDAERRLGELTKHRLEELLKSGHVEFRPELNGSTVKIDPFGRKLAQLLVNGVNVGCILIQEGYARPWRGHREDWCGEGSLAEWADTPKADCGTMASTD
jgi:micrococcal nuclease